MIICPDGKLGRGNGVPAAVRVHIQCHQGFHVLVKLEGRHGPSAAKQILPGPPQIFCRHQKPGLAKPDIPDPGGIGLIQGIHQVPEIVKIRPAHV